MRYLVISQHGFGGAMKKFESMAVDAKTYIGAAREATGCQGKLESQRFHADFGIRLISTPTKTDQKKMICVNVVRQ